MLTAFDSTCEQLVQKHNLIFKSMHNKHIVHSLQTYQQKLDEINTYQLESFNTKLRDKLSKYNSKITDIDKKLIEITTKINSINVQKTSTPHTPKSKSPFFTPQKQVSNTIATPSIQQFFHQNTLKFEH